MPKQSSQLTDSGRSSMTATSENAERNNQRATGGRSLYRTIRNEDYFSRSAVCSVYVLAVWTPKQLVNGAFRQLTFSLKRTVTFTCWYLMEMSASELCRPRRVYNVGGIHGLCAAQFDENQRRLKLQKISGWNALLTLPAAMRTSLLAFNTVGNSVLTEWRRVDVASTFRRRTCIKQAVPCYLRVR